VRPLKQLRWIAFADIEADECGGRARCDGLHGLPQGHALAPPRPLADRVAVSARLAATTGERVAAQTHQSTSSESPG
jgi:hypothetical protein